MRNVLQFFWRFPRTLTLCIIALYQRTLSPDHGPLQYLWPYGYCRHEPTCSQYAQQMIMRYGLVLGMMRALWRLLSCHPWKAPTEEKIHKTIERASQN
ncbi:MAG: membrane protein insertion efficiency factor YidD [Candidatus Peribacteraceae bacterium]